MKSVKSPNQALQSSRVAASRIISDTLSGKKIQEASNQLMEKSKLSLKERQFCADLVYGYLRNKIRLEFLMGKFLNKKEKLPNEMLILISLGLYSLFFQDKIPAYAAVNETVKLVKKSFGESLARVANGVLRNIQKLDMAIKSPDWYLDACGNPLTGYAIFYSLPEQVVSLWQKAYGWESAIKLMERSSSRPWHGVRVNPGSEAAEKLAQALAAIKKSEPISSHGFAIPPGKLPDTLARRSIDAWIKSGDLSLQAPGSLRVMEELGLARLKNSLWDCCAGSGIKTAALLEQGVDVSLATDVSWRRLINIKPFCERLHLKKPVVVQTSASRPAIAKWSGHIMADVPCSGLGVLARRPDLRLNIDKSLFWLEQANLQHEIMTRLAQLLEKGKKLVYLTCTLNPAENELLIRNILEENPELHLLNEWQTPHDHPWLEGMYGAVLEK